MKNTERHYGQYWTPNTTSTTAIPLNALLAEQIRGLKMSRNTQAFIDRVVEYRGLPKLKKGMRCEVNGKAGRVWGGNGSANLDVLFDGEKRTMNCHPDWKMKIFNDAGEVIHASEDS
jgi:hypothetical protein